MGACLSSPQRLTRLETRALVTFPEQGTQVIEGVHHEDLRAPAPEQEREVGKQQADGKLQFHRLITQRVCDFQVPVVVSSWSITGDMICSVGCPGRQCASPVSTAFRLRLLRAPHGAEQGERDPQAGGRSGTRLGPQAVSNTTLPCAYFVPLTQSPRRSSLSLFL